MPISLPGLGDVIYKVSVPVEHRLSRGRKIKSLILRWAQGIVSAKGRI